MDELTLHCYRTRATEYAAGWSACRGGVERYFAAAFTPGSGVLDIGAGCGRDVKVLVDAGFHAHGVEPCAELIAWAGKNLDGYYQWMHRDGLPGLSTVKDASYGGVLCSAVLMHLPEEQLFDAAFSIRRVLKPGGRLLISVPLGDVVGSGKRRDGDGRLFNGVPPERFQLLFERIGFRKIGRWDDADALGRPDRRWATLLFVLEAGDGKRAIDTVEGILNRDTKDATYKLALFRALAEIAQTGYATVRWDAGGNVKVPTEDIARKWLEYYWPLFESRTFIPQKNGEKPGCRKPIAFRRQLAGLAGGWKGGLSSFVVALRSRSLPVGAQKLYDEAIAKLRSTVWNMPVRYAGGGGDFSVFRYDREDRTVIVPADLWREFALLGSWIADATVLRWAELTSRISAQAIRPSQVIDLLLASPVTEREVDLVRRFYAAMADKECVWTGTGLRADGFEVDHAIPFALWRNNDLWNLLPASRGANNAKRDSLPTRALLSRRRDAVIAYWESLHREYRPRFEYETVQLGGEGLFASGNWQSRLFSALAEAVEVTAIQRGVPRWQPENMHARADAAAVAEVAARSGAAVRLVDRAEAAGEEFVRYLPYVGETAAGLPFHGLDSAFRTDRIGRRGQPAMEGIGEADFEWIECPEGVAGPKRFVVQVTGDSMEPGICPGDFVVCEYHRRIQPGREVVIMAKFEDLPDEGECAVKRVRETKNAWVFASDNPKYKPIKVPKAEGPGDYPIYGTVVYNLSKGREVE